MSFTGTKYRLINVADNHQIEDEGWTLADKNSKVPSLVRAVYFNKKFEIRKDLDGIYKYANWLPIKRILKNSHPPITYKSKGLAEYFGLKNLYITFSGYFPKIGALMQTCSFKETEAYSVCARLPQENDKILVVSSAGNTARAFAQVCSDNNIPLLLCIPYDNIGALWFKNKLNDCVKIISSPKGSDYFDAIALGDIVCKSPMFLPEGGAKNIARRDGMGTTLLSAVEVMGRIPDAYFQAIGSGTGTIAVWENYHRLIEDRRYGTHKMRLYTSQNDPFTIMYDSWKKNQRQLVDLSPEQARINAGIISAKVLSNRKPPYSIAGGVYDSLKDSNGDMFKVDNKDIEKYKQVFLEKEGIDICSAAGVAVGSLAQAIENKIIKKDEFIMLNITGGGEELAKSEGNIIYEEPKLVIDPAGNEAEIIKQVEDLFKK